MGEDWRRVARTLWEAWDPIGVRGMGGPEDEYDAYVDDVLRLLRDGADEARLSSWLEALADDRMGLPGTMADARRAARALLQLGIGPPGGA
jgi:hypothetical protein